MSHNPYNHLQDPADDAPDPCEVCGGNYEGVECATLCDGCEGCQVTGAACHECTCPQIPPPLSEDEGCWHCRKESGRCCCPGGPLTVPQAYALFLQRRGNDNDPPF